MNTKSKEAQFIASVLERAGVTPLIVDLSMKPHDLPTADITGDQVARLAGTSWQALNGYARQEAAAVMVKGGIKVLHERHEWNQSRVLNPALAAIPNTEGHGEHSRRHGSRTVVCRRERYRHVSVDWRHLTEPHYHRDHGERGERSGYCGQQLRSETESKEHQDSFSRSFLIRRYCRLRRTCQSAAGSAGLRDHPISRLGRRRQIARTAVAFRRACRCRRCDDA